MNKQTPVSIIVTFHLAKGLKFIKENWKYAAGQQLRAWKHFVIFIGKCMSVQLGLTGRAFCGTFFLFQLLGMADAQVWQDIVYRCWICCWVVHSVYVFILYSACFLFPSHHSLCFTHVWPSQWRSSGIDDYSYIGDVSGYFSCEHLD